MNDSTAKNNKNNSNQSKTIRVKTSELPVSCPPNSSETWNLHPKVYLNLSNNGEAYCQYCSTHFVLES